MNLTIKGISNKLVLELMESNLKITSMSEIEEDLYLIEISIKEDTMLLTNGKQMIFYFERREAGLREKSIILNREDFIEVSIL